MVFKNAKVKSFKDSNTHTFFCFIKNKNLQSMCVSKIDCEYHLTRMSEENVLRKIIYKELISVRHIPHIKYHTMFFVIKLVIRK